MSKQISDNSAHRKIMHDALCNYPRKVIIRICKSWNGNIGDYETTEYSDLILLILDSMGL